MGYLGIEAGKADLREVIKFLKDCGLRVGKTRQVDIKVRDAWVKFVVIEVFGFIEGLGRELSRRYNCKGLEWGGHTILGEVSAKLWHEAVKIYFPGGGSEVIPIMICDEFLSIRIPTDRVKGIKGSISLGGEVFELPLSLRDLSKVLLKGGKVAEVLKKAVEIYGKERVFSKEALEWLLTHKVVKEVREEIDFETGYVVRVEGRKIITIPLLNFILNLIKEGKVEKALEFYSKAPNEWKEKIVREVNAEKEYARALSEEEYLRALSKFLKEANRLGG